MRYYEAKPMRGIEHAPANTKAWMVVEVNTPEEDRIDRTPHIIGWTYQGKPEQNEADARLIATSLNQVAAMHEAV